MSNHPKELLLLVEDEAILALTEKRDLEKYGYSVHHVNTGEKAVQVIRENLVPVGLILMDINLGSGIDGTQAAAQILALKDIPVVFLSSHTETEVVEKTEKITSYGYVVKHSGIVVLDASIKMAFKLFHEKTNRTKAELKYRYLFENLIEEVHFWQVIRDDHGSIKTWKLVDVNPAGARSWNRNRDEILGKTPEEIWPVTQTIKLFLPIVNKIFTEQKPHTWETYFEGANQWLEMTSVAFDEYFISSGFDITRRKNRERQLQTYKHQFNLLFHGLDKPLLRCCPGAQVCSIQDANQAAVQLLGYSRDQLLALSMD